MIENCVRPLRNVEWAIKKAYMIFFFFFDKKVYMVSNVRIIIQSFNQLYTTLVVHGIMASYLSVMVHIGDQNLCLINEPSNIVWRGQVPY